MRNAKAKICTIRNKMSTTACSRPQCDELFRRIRIVKGIAEEAGLDVENLTAYTKRCLFYRAPEAIGAYEWQQVAELMSQIADQAEERNMPSVEQAIEEIFTEPLTAKSPPSSE
jgi:hypothetical protein